MRSDACRCNGAGGGVFISPAPAYADGYVSGDGARVYYGYKADADYSKERLLIKVTYYKTKDDALKGEDKGVDPLGKFVRVEYTSNNPEDTNKQPDKWALRPTWWFGVPNGLKADTISQIRLVRNERGTQEASSSPATGAKKLEKASRQGYFVASDHTYNSIDQWKHSVSRDYYSGNDQTIDGKGWKRMVGIGGKSGDYDDSGNTKDQWNVYKDGSANGLQGIFADWESAGQRYYEMSYVAEMTDTAWKQRDKNPLLFVAGIYRGVGNWRYVAGTTMHAPKIADNLELKYPKPTPVKNLGSLDSGEQAAVKKAIEDANKSADTKNPNLFDKLVAKDGISVDTKGNATITFTDGTKRVMPASLLVLKNETDKDKYKPTLPARTPVVKLSKLTDGEKTDVTQAIINANGGSKPNAFLQHVKKTSSNQYEIRVQEDGSAKVTYADESELTIPSTDLVYQGATIADWAPYILPGYTEVDNPSSLTSSEITDLIAKFDKANEKLGIYNAAKKDGKSPVTIATNGTATITWKDGSQTIVPGFLYLKKKAPDAPKPKPTGDEKKYFTVAVPTNISSVNFDPFNMKATDLTDQVNSAQLESIKDTLKALTATDTKDSNTHPQITDVTFAVDKNGVGTVTFTADNYESATYPMGMFMKQNPNNQTPKETEHNPQGKPQYKYKVKPIQYDGDAPTPLQQIQALKDFVKSNYGTDLTNDATASQGIYTLKTTDKPVEGTKGLQCYVNGQNNNAGVVSISSSTGGILVIQGYENGDPNSKTLFTVPASELYVKRSASTDHTVSDLKQQAKELLAKRKGEGLKDSDFAKAGIENPANLNDNTINGMTEQQLRELIRKLTDAKKAERKYNTPAAIVAKDPNNPTEDDFKKAVEAFVKANYNNSDNFNANGVTTALPTDLTPKSGTIDMEIADNNIKSVTSSKTGGADDYKSMVFKDSKGTQLFTVAISYRKKEETPKLSGDELNEMRKQAKETIDHNPNLTKKDKKGFDNRIDTANTAEEIQKILKEAADKAGENAKSADPTVSNEISGNQNGTDAKNQQNLNAAKEAAKNAIENLPNLTPDEKNTLKGKVDKANSIDGENGVNSVVDEAKKLSELKGAKDGAKEAAKQLYFLDHGTGAAENAADTHAEDAALNSVLGTTPAEDSTLKTLLEDLKDNSTATADDIRTALEAAKNANAKNTQKAKDAANKKLEEKRDALKNAYDALTSDQQTKAKDKYEAAIQAINDAESSVNNATKPSQIKTALESVDTKIEAANNDIKTNTPQRDKTGNTNDPDATTFQSEKDKAKKEIDNIPGLSQDEKDKYKKEIDDSNHKGDPEAIVNHALKHKKIEDAKKQIAALDYLNKAQKKYYEDLLDSTDASDHVDEDGKSTGKDDIDDALEQALNLNGVMKRLADLATIADKLKKDDKDQKYSSADKTKKDAFDAALTAANTQLDKVTGADSDNINADGANALYNDLLTAMQGLDSSVKGVGLYTDDLQKEYDADLALKEKPVYKNATQNVKDSFDIAFEAAKTALDNAKDENKVTQLGKTAAEQQNAIGAALANLVNARKALDGVDTTALQAEVNKDKPLTDKPVYKNATKDKKTAFDKALAAAEDAIADAEGKKQLAADEDPKTQEQKQKAVNDALTALQNAAKALDGKETTPTPVTPVNPTPTPAPSPVVDKSHLQQGINDGNDVHNSDEYTNAPSDKKQAYDHALDHANEVNNDPNATQDQVNQAAEDLHNAQKDLHDSATVDKSYLQWEVSDDVAFRGRGSYLVADASLKDAYNAALSEARRVLSDPNATQDQVNAALAKLREAKRNILQANGLSGEEYAGDGTPGTDNNGSTPGTGNTGAGNTGTGDFGFGNTGTVPGSGVVPGTVPGSVPGTVPGSVPGSGDSGFGSTGSTNAGTTNSGTTNSGSGHEGDSSLGFGVNDDAPTTVDKGELNLQIEGAESGSKPGSNSGAAGNGSNSAAGAAGSNASAGTTGAAGSNAAAGAAAGNAAGSNAGNAAAGSAAANGLAAAKVNAVVENSQAVKRADAQVAAAEAAVNTALAEAKKVAADPNATQAQVDAAAQKLADARKSLAAAQDNASRVRAVVREQVLKSFKGSKLSKTGSDVSVFGMFAAGVAAAGAALFVSKRRGISRHCSK